MGSKVVVTRSKLDLLADSVSAKSGESLPLTIGEMKVAVDSIVLNSQIIGDGDLELDENDYLYFDDDGGGGGITPTGTINITTNGTHDVTNYASANVSVSSSALIVDTVDSAGGTVRTITTIDEVHLQTKTITPTSSQQTVLPDTGYDGFSSVIVGASSGGGSSGQSVTGTFTGNNGITVQISCSFAPDVIYIHGDLTGDVSHRGINSVSIIKDNALYVTSDSSTSATTLSATYFKSDITSYNESNSSAPHASYSNGVLTIDMVENTSAKRFASGITYTYKLSTLGSGTPSATAHTIYFEFSDETDTTITAYYDNSFISDAITATTPTTYNNKTVTLAQLDGTTWYEVSSGIPLNTELVDYTAVTTGYYVHDDGSIVTGDPWNCITDYIPIDSSMTFSFVSAAWYGIGFYNSSKSRISGYVSNDIPNSTVSGDYVHGTLTSSIIPSNAAYVVLTGNSYALSSNYLSLIRTA